MKIKIYKGRKIRHKLDERVIIVRSACFFSSTGDDFMGTEVFKGVYVNKVTGKLEEDTFILEEVKSCA